MKWRVLGNLSFDYFYVSFLGLVIYPGEYSSSTLPGGKKSGCQYSESWSTKEGWKFSALGIWLAINYSCILHVQRLFFFPLQRITSTYREEIIIQEWGMEKGNSFKKVPLPIFSILPFHLFAPSSRVSGAVVPEPFLKILQCNFDWSLDSSLHLTALD